MVGDNKASDVSSSISGLLILDIKWWPFIHGRGMDEYLFFKDIQIELALVTSPGVVIHLMVTESDDILDP